MTDTNTFDTKAWSTLEIKSVSDDQRIITGIASTPSTDLAGDIVEPKGAKFSLPLPLLHQHDHSAPIGKVLDAVVTDRGIEVTAQIAKDTGLDYVDNAWKQIKSGLIGGLSIGFRALKAEPLKSGARKFLSYQIFELSAVTLPCNVEATITSIKKFDESPIDPDQLIKQEMAIHDARQAAAAAVELINNALTQKE